MVSQKPIFIIGFPRSGTTFLQSLLCTQENLISFPETHFFNKAMGHYSPEKKINKSEFQEALNVLLDKTKAEFDEETLDKLKKESESGLDQRVFLEALLSTMAQKRKIDLHDDQWRWIEKTPSHALYMENILAIYPQAKFIAIIRNPLNAIDSYYNKLTDYRKPFHDLAAEYRDTYEAIENFKRFHSDKVEVLKYEDLVKKESSIMKKVMGFLAHPYRPELLENYTIEASKLIVEGETWKKNNIAKNHKAVKHSLSLKSILQIEDVLYSFFKKYNYPIEKGLMLRMYRAYRSKN